MVRWVASVCFAKWGLSVFLSVALFVGHDNTSNNVVAVPVPEATSTNVIHTTTSAVSSASSPCTDCDGNNCVGFEEWVGDGICDDGSGPDSDSNSDSGSGSNPDTLGVTTTTSSSSSSSSSVRGQHTAFNFLCAAFSNDGGDCESESGQAPTLACVDCAGNNCTGFER